MISLHPCSVSSLGDLKGEYLKSLVAPMDGMWETGYTNPAPHWEIRMDGERAGYFVANVDGILLQFYVGPAFERHGRALFDRVIAEGRLTEAVVSTIDPACLSLCLDVQKQVTVHTYLYESRVVVHPTPPKAEGLNLRLVEARELERAIVFQQACLASDQDLSGWLRTYSGNLIEREELFVLCREDAWMGLGECRRSDTQEGVTDLGMMVIPAHRGKGWATHILTRLHALCKVEGRQAICSTTVENVGAQKAITRSGFVSRHRIMNVAF